MMPACGSGCRDQSAMGPSIRLRCACAGASVKCCAMPIAIPVSIPISGMTTLNVRLHSSGRRGGACEPASGELTHGPRLCYLMSLTGLAYLSLGIEP